MELSTSQSMSDCPYTNLPRVVAMQKAFRVCAIFSEAREQVI